MNKLKVSNPMCTACLILIMSLPSISLATEGEPEDGRAAVPAVRTQVTPAEFGSDRSLIGRLLWGPTPRRQDLDTGTTLSFKGSQSGSIRLDNLRGGLVSYDTVEALEFYMPILNSPWFFDTIHQALERNGVLSLTFTKRNNDFSRTTEEVTRPRAEVRQSLTLIPEILDQHGDQIAESVLNQLKKLLKVEEASLTAAQISKVVSETSLTVEQIKELRKFLISNTLNESELIDAIHLSTYKASHLVALELKRATGLIRFRNRRQAQIAGYGSAAVATGGVSLATSSLFTYMGQLAEYGLSWGEGFVFREGYGGRDILSFQGREYSFDSWYRDTLNRNIEELGSLGLDAGSLVNLPNNLTVGIPYLEFGVAAASVLSLSYFAPKLWKQSKPYLALLRNRFLNGYLGVMRSEGLLTNRQVELQRAEAAGLTSGDDRLAIRSDEFNFADASDISVMGNQIDNFEPPVIIQEQGFATQVMVLGQGNIHLGTQVLGKFTGDMANWITVAQFYKRQLNTVVRTERDVNFGDVTNVSEAYSERLTALSARIEAYERVVSALDAHVLGNISFLENLLVDDQYRQYLTIRQDGLSDYDIRARDAIENRISDLVSFRNGTLAIIRLSLGNAFNANSNDARDISKLVQILSTITLSQTADNMAELNRTVQDLIGRKVGELVSKPSKEALAALDEADTEGRNSPLEDGAGSGPLSCGMFL